MSPGLPGASDPAGIRVLDVRALAPPEPLERVLDALAELPKGGRLRVLHRREPFPLYDLLAAQGYAWRTRGQEGRYDILIWEASAPPGLDETEAGPPC